VGHARTCSSSLARTPTRRLNLRAKRWCRPRGSPRRSLSSNEPGDISGASNEVIGPPAPKRFSSRPSRNRSCLRDCRTGLFRSPRHSRRKMKFCAQRLSPNWRTKSPILESLPRAFWRNTLLIPDMSGTLREAKNAAKTRSSLVEPDGIEPTTSSMPLLKSVVYSRSRAFLFIPTALAKQSVAAHSHSALFLPIYFRCRYGADMKSLHAGSEAHEKKR
jgi:hypothetical protein